MVTVPHIVPEVRAMRKDPVVAYMPDLFTRPVSLRPDVILNITEEFPTICRMLACHQSQLFEWLAYEDGIEETVPDEEHERLKWAEDWFGRRVRPRANRYRDDIVTRLDSPYGEEIDFIEMFEISEYARQPNAAFIATLFPNAL